MDLNEALDPTKDVIDRLANDPVLMMDIVYLCCKKQMDAQDVTLEEFSDSISGDVIENAAQALINAIIDFFPSSKTEVIRESLALKDRMVSRIQKKALKSLRSITEEQMEQAAEKLVQQSGNTSTPVLVSSD